MIRSRDSNYPDPQINLCSRVHSTGRYLARIKSTARCVQASIFCSLFISSVSRLNRSNFHVPFLDIRPRCSTSSPKFVQADVRLLAADLFSSLCSVTPWSYTELILLCNIFGTSLNLSPTLEYCLQAAAKFLVIGCHDWPFPCNATLQTAETQMTALRREM
jgi:hypothetical protein